MAEPSAFLQVSPEEHLCANAMAFAVLDHDPVTAGHALVILRRQVATWWDATPTERAALTELVDEVKALLDERYAPDGYNVGFNAGRAAGQTVDHLHIHVIPRRHGDTDDPDGGIRRVIAAPAELARSPRSAHLIDARDERFLKLELLRCLINDEFDRIDLLVSFIMKSGLKLIAGHLADALERGAVVRILTTDYLQVTDADALAQLLDLAESSDVLPGALDVKVFSDPLTSFHPKAYLFWSSNGQTARGFVGSSNLSKSGIAEGVEWNLRTDEVAHLVNAFEALWHEPRSLALDHLFLRSYRERWVPTAGTVVPIGVETEEPVQPVAPRPIQTEALAALENTRADGHAAGLVVLATGLGKTWLAGFDSTRPEFRRTLFVAHREEILRQSRDVFRQVRPDAQLGLYFGDEKQPDADVVFASIQTLARHLHRFDADAFDYIVVDEFHHAAARSYRTVLDHFTPRFLLGLTATPDRTDGADLLALCGDNLVFQLDLVDGIARGELSPFQYWGIRDVADYAHIPWRNGRFDPAELAAAVETQDRAQQALDEWRLKAGSRTLGFCCSISHADYMVEFFRAAGVSVEAVHSGPGSASRQQAVERLRAGALQVLFSVDVFNEGVDVPEIDTVLMLRPTESPVLFLQQLGRGLRRSEGKERLEVIDFVGNHRSFLLKPRALLGLGTGATPTNAELQAAIESGDFQLPDGCSITLELGVVELLTELLRKHLRTSALEEWCVSWAAEHDGRPTAMQALRSGYNPAAARKRDGHWFGLLDRLGLITDEERSVVERHGDVLVAITTEAITKSYKLVTLRALLHDGTLRSGTTVSSVAATAHHLVGGDPRLIADVRSNDNPDPAGASPEAWERYWREWPLTHLAKPKQSGDSLFRLDADRFEPRFAIDPSLGDTFDEMVAELVDWRLAAYLEKIRTTSAGGAWKVVDDHGTELDSTWSFEVSDTGTDLVIHAAGGTKGSGQERNLDYRTGLTLVLGRLFGAGVTLKEVLVDSRPARQLPESERRIDASGFGTGPFQVDASDMDRFAGAVARGAASIARAPGAKSGGNSRKRLRFVIDHPDIDIGLLGERLRTGEDASAPVRCRVIQTGGRPIVMLDTARRDALPTGEVTLAVDGVEHVGRFVKIALNVVTRPGSTDNVLPEILRRWFGAAAGQPGTAHEVEVQRRGEKWTMSQAATVIESATDAG